MKTLRIVATVVTAGTMLGGGVMLTTSGQPVVIVLGVFTAVVGAFYGFAGLSVERVRAAGPARPSEPLASEVDNDHAPAGAGVLAVHGSDRTG